MDYHLQNLRTGETIGLSPQRTLIGTAEHANIKIAEGGPYLAAHAVRYPTGWLLTGLSDEGVTFNRRPLRAMERVTPRKGDLLVIGDERFTFLSPRAEPTASTPDEDIPPPTCFAYIRNPDGMEECRVVDHDLLFGRLAVCHVQLSDSRLSRLSALLATHGGEWFIHALSKKPLGRNRKPVAYFTRIENGDELLIGPLVVRIEIRSADEPVSEPQVTESQMGWPDPPDVPSRRANSSPSGLPSPATDFPELTDTPGPRDPSAGPDLAALQSAAQQLEQWMKSHHVTPPPQEGGIRGWLGAQRDRLKRFWFDTPETTSARSLRTAGRVEEAFAVLDRAIRARPDSPELLRELYRLYESVGLIELCYRPLRQIEKIANARGKPDPWVLETLARLCERLSRNNPPMFQRALDYWGKLETATGTSYSRERTAALARRALRESGFAGHSEGT
ncbi:MAG: hypothetical protein L0241_14080 [Planctomycetia bacterium]|nr:hypothetical protein [Planctomycetia bacterium]